MYGGSVGWRMGAATGVLVTNIACNGRNTSGSRDRVRVEITIVGVRVGRRIRVQ